MSRHRFQLELDDRTGEMSAEALQCRSWSHWWVSVPQGAARRKALLELGQLEAHRVCDRCGARKVELIDLNTWDVLSSRIDYPEGYLIQRGSSGRLPRREARKAMFVRSGERLF